MMQLIFTTLLFPSCYGIAYCVRLSESVGHCKCDVTVTITGLFLTEIAILYESTFYPQKMWVIQYIPVYGKHYKSRLIVKAIFHLNLILACTVI